MSLVKLIQNYDYEPPSSMILKMLLRILDIKLYYNSEGLDLDEAIAIINEIHVENYYDDNFITSIFENVNFVKEINFVYKKRFEIFGMLGRPQCVGTRHHFSPRLLGSAH